jgi:hypothetical protein
MATSIFFTESRDFKLIKDRILNQEDNYLVYVYADTTNIRIPRELIMELPKYGNNLIWVDTAEMDTSDLSHHIVLTIGQLINPEEEIDFYIVSKSSKLEKTIIFLRNQGIAAEMIAPAQDKSKKSKTKKSGRRGRPKKAATEEGSVVETGKKGRLKKEKPVNESVEGQVKSGKRGRPKKNQAESTEAAAPMETPKKKRGRPSVAKAPAEEAIPAEPKKRGRKPSAINEDSAEKTVAKKEKKGKPAKKAKEAKEPRKQRIDKEITEDMIQEKLSLYTTADPNTSMVMTRLFGLKKVARPKFESKLIDMIKDLTLEDDSMAEQVVNQLKEMQILQAGDAGRILYKD